MAPRTKREPRLSDDKLRELLGLLKGADSVELKLTLPEKDHRSAVSALGIDPLEAQIRQVFFFDTPDLTLNAEGVVVRARRIQRRPDDSVVKLRPIVPSKLPVSLRKNANCVVEVDAMPGGYVCSASFKGTLANNHVKSAAEGKRSISKLFSKEQRRFYSDHAPEGVRLNDLTTLGPITVLKLKFRPKDYERKLVAEMWLYPNGSRILELSTKCSPSDAFQVALESRVFLSEQGIDLTAEQQTKTKTALNYFSGLAKSPATASSSPP
jgi:hypothetical protein